MNDVIGFYILCRVWDHLLYKVGDQTAMNLVSNLKARIIKECSTDARDRIYAMLDCMSWKDDTQ